MWTCFVKFSSSLVTKFFSSDTQDHSRELMFCMWSNFPKYLSSLYIVPKYLHIFAYDFFLSKLKHLGQNLLSTLFNGNYFCRAELLIISNNLSFLTFPLVNDAYWHPHHSSSSTSSLPTWNFLHHLSTWVCDMHCSLLNSKYEKIW